jgi:translation initiation factor IF-2
MEQQSTPDRNKTMFAAQAVSLADTFQIFMVRERVGTSRKYKLELSAPDGPSTAGGKQAMQHIKLVPEDGHGTLVMGSCDQVHNQAKIRVHEHLAAMYAERYQGEKLPIGEEEYQKLCHTVAKFFEQRGLQVSAEAVPAPRATPAPVQAKPTASGQTSPLPWILLTVVLTSAILGAVYYFVLR